MFIIFDLDDTLIDTSACITPVKLERALSRMIQEGMEIEDFSQALHTLLQIDQLSDSARSALEEFIEINGFDSRFLSIGLNEVYHQFCDDLPVFPVEEAVSVLSKLSYEHKMAIVSIGNLDQQLWKLKKAGIDSSLFCKIHILEEKNKKETYQALIQEMNISPQEVIVCGDRIPIDLAPAKQLGCMTVHMKKGRGLYSSSIEKLHEVDFTITHLSQMQKVLLDISSKASFD
ncbi:MAG: HAD family hydrolase [Rhabdochlamydiaceae bacterium]|nr:HAD family hydrolase [Rhabdochlamydiaceae bacterium]